MWPRVKTLDLDELQASKNSGTLTDVQGVNQQTSQYKVKYALDIKPG